MVGVGVGVAVPVSIIVPLSNWEKQIEILLEMLLLAVALTAPVHLRHGAPAVKYAGQAQGSAVHVVAWSIGPQTLEQTTVEAIVKGVIGANIVVDARLGNKSAQSCTAVANR